MGSIVQQPFLAADWRGRVFELVDRRAVGFEKMKPFLLAGQVHRHRSAFLKTAHAQFVGILRNILMAILPKDAARDAGIGCVDVRHARSLGRHIGIAGKLAQAIGIGEGGQRYFIHIL